jgi:hypothetical protein
MDVFAAYKPIRNKIAQLAADDSLGVLWAYCQFLQINGFQPPKEIEIASVYLNASPRQSYIAEWDIELLAKEVVINSGSVGSKGRTLRTWKTLAELVNGFKSLEQDIYRQFGNRGNVLIELIRVMHRQIIWQTNPPNARSIIRYYKIFNRSGIDAICSEKFGLTVWQIYVCGIACMGFYLDKPALVASFTSQIKGFPPDVIERFLTFVSLPLGDLRKVLKAEQQYDERFVYAYNSLRRYPLIRMNYQGQDAVVCPLMTLLYWKFTGGLYYELIDDPRFGNEFGEGFQAYVGSVIEKACPKFQCFAEQEYRVGKITKRTVDWIVAGSDAVLFLECKARRLSLQSKTTLTDVSHLEDNIENLAAAVVQVYKTLNDCLTGGYPHYSHQEGDQIYPAVVTLENWRLLGSVMFELLERSVKVQMEEAGIPQLLIELFPYSVWAIDELEVGLQIMQSKGIKSFMDGKLGSKPMSFWDWHGYMSSSYASRYPFKALFDDEYDAMFADLYSAQESELPESAVSGT